MPLAGGNMGPVTRRGDHVLRTAGEWTPAVHRLMRYCRERGLTEVPEPHGILDDGREQIDFIPGEVPNYPIPAWAWSLETLQASADLLRRFHEASRDADRTGPWRSPVREPVEVVCHNDFAPYNLVFEAGRPVGVIDFDFAAPGPRIWDVANLAHRIVPLTTDRADGFTDSERLDRLDALLASYGDFAAGEVLAKVADFLGFLADFSDAKAVELGNPELHDHAALYRRDIALVHQLADQAAGR